MMFFRFCLRLSLLLALFGCGAGQADDNISSQIWTWLTSSEDDVSAAPDVGALRAGLTPAVLAQIGEPVLIAQVPSRNAVAAMVRIGSNNGVDTYLTPDGISISTRDGMIVGTRGFGFDLMTADIAEPLSAVTGRADRAVRVHRYLDGENQLIIRSFACRYAAAGDRRIAETCQSSDFSFVNDYVVDEQGRIRSSRQWMSPQIGSILTEHVE
ncbi:YjbF family lipoprotein [Yoonia sp. SDW83-1]|uniref:YjbF family lipoprotein n=1 Tax=Yoonia sp. SDW83-1 TaxID=3366945 RepID=UPI00398C684B